MKFTRCRSAGSLRLPTLEAVRRADGEILGRITERGRGEGLESILIVKKGSGVTSMRCSNAASG